MSKKVARENIRQFHGLSLPTEAVYVESVSQVGDHAVVEATVKTGFKFRSVGGRWELQEIRLGEGEWQNLPALIRALEEVRRQEARRLLESLARGLENYREKNGEYPRAPTLQELADALSPAYMPALQMLDPWRNEIVYRTTQEGFLLLSPGPDHLEGTDDDVAVRR
ncbi:MAG: type II secretion system protein GspG [Acidobacteria bacterium]|nr:type II secretion system protein GspG [Acidobacteriota bacterium]